MTIKHDSGVRRHVPSPARCWLVGDKEMVALPHSKDMDAYLRYQEFCQDRGIAAMSFDQWRINDSGMTARGSFAW